METLDYNVKERMSKLIFVIMVFAILTKHKLWFTVTQENPLEITVLHYQNRTRQTISEMINRQNRYLRLCITAVISPTDGT